MENNIITPDFNTSMKLPRAIMRWLAAFAMAILVPFSQAMGQTYSGGDGAETTPYLISSVTDLQALATAVNGGATYIGNYFRLTADIDLSGVCGSDVGGTEVSWTPIGTDSNRFSGYFKGGGHTISNLYINASSSNYQGLFGYIISASIDSLNLVGTNITGQNFVGGVCGSASSSTISYCGNSGSVSGGAYVGGVCGNAWDSSTISYSTNSSSVSGRTDVGGVCGNVLSSSSISYSTNSGSVSGGGSNVGGVCGNAWDSSTISYSTNSGSVSGGGSNVGGVCGSASSSISSISYSTNSGSVSGSSYVGGVCGNASGSISYSTNSGSVSASGGSYVGGVCGRASNSISYSTNSGSVNGSSYVGGVCGRISSSNISYSINSGSVSGGSFVGGVCGSVSSSTTSYCYFDKQLCAVANAVGANANLLTDAGKFTHEMTGEALRTGPSGEGFTDEHWVFTNDLYPRLKGTETSNVAIAAATPIFLAYTDADNYETVALITSDFTVGTGNGVTWACTQDNISISGNTATVGSRFGANRLVASIGGVTYKTIPIIVNDSESSPLVIDEVSDLEALAAGVNSGTTFPYWNDASVLIPALGEAVYFRLTADIDLSGVCGSDVGGTEVSWTPIGTDINYPFSGHFNGDNHTISNLYINASSSNNQGLFGYIRSASIDSLNLVGTNITGQSFVGGVCGHALSSAISYSTNSGRVSGSNNVGGVCGYASSSTISYCTNSCSVSGDSYVGGVCGQALSSSPISYSINSGSVSGGGSCVGGVCGRTSSSAISYSTNSGRVSGGSSVGGVCGQASSSIISYCYYDKQLCTIANAVGSDATLLTDAGKLTHEMTGEALKTGSSGEGFTDEHWAFSNGLYPRLKGLNETSNAAIVAATPIFLAYTDVDNYETVARITSDFTVGTGNGVTWSSKQGKVIFNGSTAIIISHGVDTLTCTLGSEVKNIIVSLETVDRVELTHNIQLTTTKTYDGNTSVTYTGGLIDVPAGEDVTLTATFAYNSKNVTEATTITATTWELSGADAGNYYVLPFAPTASVASITAKGLTVSGTTVTVEKAYDGTTDAAVTGNGTLQGVVAGDEVSLSTVVANYDNNEIATGKTITVSYALAGADEDNYTIEDAVYTNEGVITVATGIEDIEGVTLSVYPNPATVEVNMMLPSVAGEVTVWDAIGNMVYRSTEVEASGELFTISISSWKHGFYIIKYVGEDGRVSVLRFIKQ